MNFRKYNSPLNEPRYDRLSRERNPERTLENLIKTPLSNPEINENDNSPNSFLNNIFSIIPSPIIKTAMGLGLVGAIAACGGQGDTKSSNPTPTNTPPAKAESNTQPQNTPEIKIDFDKLSIPNIPSINFDGTYDAYFLVQKPRSEFQESLKERFKDDIKKYVQAINADNKFNFKESLKKFASDVFGHDYFSFIPDTIDLYRDAWESSITENNLHIPLETFFEFSMGDIINQTKYDVTPKFSVQTETGKLIPFDNLEELVMDKDEFNKLRQEFLDGKTSNPLEWTMQNGPDNSGYIDIMINPNLTKEWDVDIGDIFSRLSILGDTIYIYGRSLNQFSTLTGEKTGGSSLRVIGGTPAVIDGIVFAPGFLTASEAGSGYLNARLYAFDTDNNEIIWQKKMLNPKSPLIDGNTVYIVDQENQLQSRNIFDGSLYWNLNLDEYIGIIGSPKITEDSIYFFGFTVGQGYQIHSLSKNGNLNWKADATPNLGENRRIFDIGIPLLAGNYLIWDNEILSFKDNGDPIIDVCLEAFNIETRSVVLDECIGLRESSVKSKVSDGKDVYFSTENRILRYTAEEDELRQLPTITLENDIFDSVLTRNYLIVATDLSIIAIDRKNPDVRKNIYNFGFETEIFRINMSISGGDLYVVTSPKGPNQILKFSAP